MIIVLKANRSEEQVKNFISNLTDRYDVSVNTWVGTHSTVLGLIGDTAAVDSEYIAAQDIVESVKRVQEPYKKANRKFHPEDTVIKLPTGQVIGDGSLALIAGPCSVESEAQICCVAERVKAAGATFLRGEPIEKAKRKKPGNTSEKERPQKKRFRRRRRKKETSPGTPQENS